MQGGLDWKINMGGASPLKMVQKTINCTLKAKYKQQCLGSYKLKLRVLSKQVNFHLTVGLQILPELQCFLKKDSSYAVMCHNILAKGSLYKKNKLGLSCAKLSTAQASYHQLGSLHQLGLLTQPAVARSGSMGELQLRNY